MGDYWDGGTWSYQANILNDGVTSGTHDYRVQPGRGNEMEILYGYIFNGDTSARVSVVRIQDSAGSLNLGFLTDRNISVTAGEVLGFPTSIAGTSYNDQPSLPGRAIVSGVSQLHAQVGSVAVSQDSVFTITARIRGGVPTVTLTSPAGATETVDLNVVT